MIIDSHQHFWKYNPVKDAWIDHSMEMLKNDFLPHHLSPILEANGVGGCIAVQADQSEEETCFLLDLAAKNEFIKGVVGWVDLTSADVTERLAHFSTFEKFKGVRHILQDEKEAYMLEKDFLTGISKLQKFNLVYDILVSPNQLANTFQLVEKFPNQIFVLDHIGKPNIKKGEIDNWKKQIIRLAKHPNVYCKISGLVTEADWKHWSVDDMNAYLEVVFSSFGIDRILFGSDWPVCLLAADYSRVLHVIKDFMIQLPDTDKDKILGQNAINVYHLNQH